jgi:transposase
MRNRVKLARVDSEARRFDIEVVRQMLFEKGLTITSVFIERVMDATSGVPTRVCVPLYLPAIMLIFFGEKT